MEHAGSDQTCFFNEVSRETSLATKKIKKTFMRTSPKCFRDFLESTEMHKAVLGINSSNSREILGAKFNSHNPKGIYLQQSKIVNTYPLSVLLKTHLLLHFCAIFSALCKVVSLAQALQICVCKWCIENEKHTMT